MVYAHPIFSLFFLEVLFWKEKSVIKHVLAMDIAP